MAAPLSARETEVLLRIGNGQRDRRIAEELGLSVHGVRHHLRKVFARLRVRRCGEAAPGAGTGTAVGRVLSRPAARAPLPVARQSG